MATKGGGKRRKLLIGVVVLAVFLGSVGVALTSNGRLPGTGTTVARAAFTDVGSLVVGDDVRIGGVRVGRVSEIVLENGQPVATLEFDGDRTIYRNSRAEAASVGARSALGQKYVDFFPGKAEAGELGEGEIIPAVRTQGAQELSDVLAVLDGPTRTALGSTLREVGGGMSGHSQDVKDALRSLPTMLPDLGTVSAALTADGGKDLTTLLRVTDSLSRRFAQRQDQIADTVAQLDRTLAAVAVDGAGPLGDTVTKAADTLPTVRSALRSLDAPLTDTEAAMARLRRGSVALGEAAPDVRAVLRDSRLPLGKLPGVSRKAVPAVEALTGTFADARPVAADLRAAFGDLRVPLRVLAPYSPEVAMFFTYGAGALSQSDDAGHWLRFYVIANAESVDGALPAVRDPLVARNAYPAPGEAARDRRPGIAGFGGGAR